MLEGLATWVLNTYLGQYLENLNTDQLSIGLLRGEVELENVPLRKDALRHLDIPLQVVSGFVGRVKLQIPVARLRSEPWVVVFEQLYVVVAPIHLEDYNEEAAADARHTRKLTQLNGLEASWRAEQASKAGEPYAAAATSWFSFGTSIVTNIVENIQLRIHDVHLRYEDNQSVAGQVFSCGLTVGSLTAQSTDSSWMPTFVRSSASDAVSYKLLELTDLSLYWDTSATLCTGHTLPHLLDALQRSSSHQYVVQPVSATACLRRHLTPSPLMSRTTPRVACHLTMPSFPVHLTEQQFSQMVQANRLYDRLDRSRHYKRYRPSCPVRGNAADWWQYAMQCHLDQIHIRRENANWDVVLERSRDLVEYVEVYAKHLINPNTVPSDHKEVMNRLEQLLGFNELKALREVAMRRVEDLTPKHTPTHSATSPADPVSNPSPSSLVASNVLSSPASETETSSASSQPSSSGETLLQRWFPSWTGWYSTSSNDAEQTDDALTVTSDDELQSLYLTPGTSRRNSPPQTSRDDSYAELYSQFGYTASSSPSASGHLRSRERERTTSASLEEEFLYVLSDSIENNTFTKRDAVFCQLSFTLKKGIFTLSKESVNVSSPQLSELFQLEFSDVKMGLESRPRNQSYKFDIELGSLLLRDKVTKDSAFPYLIAPQVPAESSSYHYYRAARAASNQTAGLGSSLPHGAFSRSISGSGESEGRKQSADSAASCAGGPWTGKHVFSLSYEHCPVNTQADHRLHVVTQPLDLVYNPDAIDAATDFFFLPLQSTSKYYHCTLQVPSTTLSIAARKRYDALMEHTKQELKKNWDQIVQGGMRRRWAINLDISAPQIIIPAHFRDSKSPLVVIDFGRLTFCSTNSSKLASKKVKQDSEESMQPQSVRNKLNTWGGFMAKMLGHATVDEEEDDEFATPCSTPNESGSSDTGSRHDGELTGTPQPLTEELLHSHMYDKYELQLCDMQVLVGKVRDNWRFAYHRGTGPMHVIDRFSISVLVSRRVVAVLPNDRPWPAATLSATLPSIMLHLNQTKVQALYSLASTISRRHHNGHPQASTANVSQASVHEVTIPRSETSSTLKGLASETLSEDAVSVKSSDTATGKGLKEVRGSQGSLDVTDSSSTLHEDSRLLVMQLNIEKLSIELVSRGRSIAELQVTGVSGIVQHRPYNYSASLSIHSLLLVDALQTFGPDFELLLASHKHISMDSLSGSLRDSEPCSPISPASPDHSIASSQSLRPTSPHMLSKALHALATSPPHLKAARPLFQRHVSDPSGICTPLSVRFGSGDIDSEALICIEVTYVSSECPTHEGSGPLLLGSLQFNSIDIIANQETVVELLGFITQLMPKSSDGVSTLTQVTSQSSAAAQQNLPDTSVKLDANEVHNNLNNQSMYGSLAMLYTPAYFEAVQGTNSFESSKKEPLRVEMCFDINKLSVLLLRAAIKDREVVGRKVATAVLSQARIQTAVANHQLTVEGSLGGFHVRDVTPEANKHQCIVSVGQDVQEKQQDILTRLTTGLYQSYTEKASEEKLKAFSFTVKRPVAFNCPSAAEIMNCYSEGDDCEHLCVDLQLASVLYTHSPTFLHEVSSCADEFKQYMARLAQSIKHAATEFAMGLVSKRIESFAVMPAYGGGGGGSDSPNRRQESLACSTDTLHLPQPPPASASHTSPTHSPPSDLTFRLRLNVVLDTPIVVLPESSNSSSVMVAQLGQINIRNADLPEIHVPQTARLEKLNGTNLRDKNKTEIFESDDRDSCVSRVVKYDIEVQDMSLYCLDIDDRSACKTYPNWGSSIRCAADLYRCGADCSAIVHRTSVQLVFCHRRSPSLLFDSHAGLYFPSDLCSVVDDDPYRSKPVDTVEITGGVVTAVKLSLARQQYRQLVQTLGNISVTKKPDPGSPSRLQHSLDCIVEENLMPSTSYNKLLQSSCDNIRKLMEAKTAESVSVVHSRDANKHFVIQGEFAVPRVEVELIGDVSVSSQPLVNLILEDFRATYEKKQPHETNTQVTLKSLVMEDLQCPESSPHRYLLRSVQPPPQVAFEKGSGQTYLPRCPQLPPCISTSCPDFKFIARKCDDVSRSLPALLELEKPYFKAQQRITVRSSFRRKRKLLQRQSTGSSVTLADVLSEPGLSSSISSKLQPSERSVPYAPPPSPIPTNESCLSSPEESCDLVRICILNVDSSSPDYLTTHDGTDRIVDVKFNSLVAVVNIPSWVMIVDFFSAKKRRESCTLVGVGKEKSLPNQAELPVEAVDDGNKQEQLEEKNSELNVVVEVSVVWLELVLVRVDGSGNLGVEVAGANVSDVAIRSVGNDGDLTLTGRLGSLSVSDRTCHGQRYQHKFMTTGTEALTFQLIQYGNLDPLMLRECDVRLNVKMSSVMYVHTQRFATELLHVIQQFSELQDKVRKWRAIRAGQQVQDNVRGLRVSLSVSAGSPVILLPLCAQGSDKVLVADLGELTINNRFLWAGEAGTISIIEREGLQERLSAGCMGSRSRSRANRSRSRSLGRSRSRNSTTESLASIGKPPKCLLDVMDVALSNMDLYAAKRMEYNASSEAICKQKLRKNKNDSAHDVIKRKGIPVPVSGKNAGADLSCQHDESEVDDEIECNDTCWRFPKCFVIIEGKPLLREKTALTLQVERNLDPHVSRRVPDVSVQGCVSKVHATINEEIYKLVRGLLQYNLGEDLTHLHFQHQQLQHPHLPKHANIRQQLSEQESSHITLNIALDLDNVTVDALVTCKGGNVDTNSDDSTGLVPLTCVNFIKSRLLFQSNSDGGKDVDLVSQEILISDTRFQDCPVNKRSNVFTNILQPTPRNASLKEGLLQAEIHYRTTKAVTRFTILVNNMRLMAILEWWQEVLAFLQLNSPNPYLMSGVVPVNNGSSQVSSSQNVNPFISMNSTPSLVPGTSSEGASPRPESPVPHMSISRKSSGLGRASPRLNPLVESTGVMTKYSLIDDLENESRGQGLDDNGDHVPPYELKINIMDSEIVIVENVALWSSPALILKNTTVLSYRPSMLERPVSCNLSQCEVYSCMLSAEEESALSILDPVTVNIEMTDRGGQHPDLANAVALTLHHVVEVSLHQINLRLSYHDLKMFQRILQSIPWLKEESHLSNEDQPANVKATAFSAYSASPAQVEQLCVLGFSREDCVAALQESSGRVDDAALWLTRHATPLAATTLATVGSSVGHNTINCQAIEIKTGSVNLCVIDDCGDCDVPLLEVSLLHLTLKQDRTWTGSAGCTLSTNYYNRFLSGWEPLLEPWKCDLHWNKTLLSGGGGAARLTFQLTAEQALEFNLTTSLLELFRMVKSSWTQDYYNRERCDVEGKAGCSGVSGTGNGSPVSYRRRSPFIPFTLLNMTGSSLSFTPIIAYTHGGVNVSEASASQQQRQWTQLEHGQSAPFSFDNYKNVKLRHCDTHEHKMHQIGVCVAGWHPVGPITVDKVGTFFRMAALMTCATVSGLASARIVVKVTLAGSARKLVTVLSALQLHNALPYPVEARLENLANRGGDVKLLEVSSQSTVAVPLAYVWAGIRVRPLGGGLKRTLARTKAGRGPPSGGWIHCHQPIHWRHLTGANETHSEIKCCPAINANQAPYRLCVHIRRENYPVDSVQSSVRPTTPPLLHPHQLLRPTSPSPDMEWVQPAHTIVLVSPFTLVNLLPFDMHYCLPNSGSNKSTSSIGPATVSASLPDHEGIIKPGGSAILHSVNPEEGIELKVWTDTLSCSGSVTINIPSSGSSSTSWQELQLRDAAERTLELQLRATRCYGRALRVSVLAHYWIINMTGLPLVFRQEGSAGDAAGQESEHEVARCGSPLLFSFSDRESPPVVVARVGWQLHAGARPHYCRRLPLTQGTYMRRLRVSLPSNRPDVVYIVGVDVRPGRGRYQDTLMVTVSPRFQIENRCSHELLLAQTCCTDGSVSCGDSTWLRSLPGSFLAFHWPRLDKDQLISIKILSGLPGYWSGGFTIDKIDSFHLNVRGAEGESRFLRIESLFKDATIFLVITDADTFPPPFRIDNFSEVAIVYHQTSTQCEYLRSVVRPHSSVAYAWDEPTLKPYLTCTAPGGVSATYNPNELRHGAQLTYENFIYIAFTGTFQNAEEDTSDLTGSGGQRREAMYLDPAAVECQQLVLDVVEGTKVQLARKQLGKRSQLWRMTSTGRLQHEGSSPPSDPSLPRRDDGNTLVLDISGPAPQPYAYTPLMLRRPDPRRQLTQTWHFTDDGRLCCRHHNLYVQAGDGFVGLTPGNNVVLGPAHGVEYCLVGAGVPIEQAVSRHRLRPGSGILALQVVADGPTRVLQITDCMAKSQLAVARTEKGQLVTLCGAHDPSHGAGTDADTVAATADGKRSDAVTPGHIEEFQLQVRVSGGLGVSVVQQNPPQELLYARLSDIVLDYNSSKHQRTLDATVKDIQVDNQTSEGGEGGVLLYVSPQSRHDDSRHLPALTLALHQLRHDTRAHNAVVLKNLRVRLKNLSLTLEEEVVCRLLVMCGCHLSDDGAAAGADTTDPLQESRTSVQAATSATDTRYYFGLLELVLNQVRLSVITNKHLSPELRSVQRKMGLNSLVSFENALVNLDPFKRLHPFETARFLADCIIKHYTEELSSQAVRILGSTDFLGNPSGLLADVSEGMSELVNQGSVKGFVGSVTHGMANSAAKMTGSLSDGIGRFTMDETHEALRQRFAMTRDGGSSEQFLNGIRGLGLGLYGGLTSIAAQTYSGAQREGVPGLFSGFAKGVVGTITKPAVGMLDLFSGAAYAVRDTSKTPLSRSVCRVRPCRVVLGPTGLLPRYNHNLARGQHLLKIMPHYKPSEIVVAYECLLGGAEDMCALVSSERVRVFSEADTGAAPVIVLTTTYTEILECRSVIHEAHRTVGDFGQMRHYVELTIIADPRQQHQLEQSAVKRPKVRCDSQDIAEKVSQQINCARNLYAELCQTVHEVEAEEEE